jgi:hypothetical protein
MRDPRLTKVTALAKDLGNVPLVLDVIGPFVVQFQQGDECRPGWAIICAPLCGDHHANLLTDSDDVSVNGLSGPADRGFVYRFCKDHSPKGARWCQPRSSHDIFRVKYPTGDPVYSLDAAAVARNCFATFLIPMPNWIVALRSECGWVHRNDAKMWVIDEDTANEASPGCAVDHQNIVSSPRGRGLRLIYDECTAPPDFCLGSDVPANLRAETKGFISGSSKLPPYYSITLRFAASHATGDGIDDAHTCFQTIRALFDIPGKPSEFSKWRTDFAHLPGSGLMPLRQGAEHVGGANPRDCGSMVLAMQDWDDADVPSAKSSKRPAKRP